jgi:hypothetical protein
MNEVLANIHTQSSNTIMEANETLSATTVRMHIKLSKAWFNPYPANVENRVSS